MASCRRGSAAIAASVCSPTGSASEGGQRSAGARASAGGVEGEKEGRPMSIDVAESVTGCAFHMGHQYEVGPPHPVQQGDDGVAPYDVADNSC